MRSLWERARKKDNFEVFHFQLHRSLSKEVWKEPPSGSVKARLYVNFLDFFFSFAYKIFAVTSLNIIPLTERTFQSRRKVDFLEKKQFSLQFSITCYMFT